MNAEIIAVGTELLLGDILNTNAQFLSKQLSLLGIDVFYQSVVGDNPDRLKTTISQAIDRSDVVLLSGGLGPTDDDLTKEMVAQYFNLPLYFDQSVADEIKNYLKGRAFDSNQKQALIPQGATIIHNNYGTAPGIIIEKDGKIAILLPGPPRELCPLFLEQVMSFLKARSDYTMVSRVVRLFGIGEAVVGEKIKDLMESANPTLAPYAKDNEVTLRITAKTKTEGEAEKLINEMLGKVKERVGEYIYGYDDNELKYVVGDLLMKNNLTISAAESCTAGLFSATLVDNAGISKVFHQSIVTYSNEAKEQYLGVSSDTLARHGAVSEQTAYEMAVGIQKRAKSDIGVSITGIAGPDGGTPEKPVGLVYVGVCYGDKVRVKQLSLFGTREKIRQSAVMNALSEVRKIILNLN